MYKKYIIFYILLHASHVLSVDTVSDQPTSQQSSSIADSSITPKPPSDVLPLIVIKENHVYVVNPTKILAAFTTENSSVLKGGTIFATSTSRPDDQSFMCPLKNYEHKKEETKDLSMEHTKSDDEYCLFPIYFETLAPLRCSNQPEPFVAKYYSPKGPDTPTVGCGAAGEGTIYSFVYKACLTENPIKNTEQSNLISSTKYPIKFRAHLETYRFCYHERKREILYTKHKIMSLKLLNDVDLKNEREATYDMITEGYPIFDSQFETMKQQYDRFLRENPSHRIQKLVPSDDFAFAVLRKTTYHYLNTTVIPNEHAELWDHISELIRKRAIQDERQYIIYTAAFTLSQNTIEITSDGQLRKPDTWIKIIYDIDNKTKKLDNQRTETLAIIMIDNLNDKSLANFYEKSCNENLCENAFIDKFPNVGKVKCCSMSNTIDKYFELKLKVTKTMDTEFLFKTTREDHFFNENAHIESMLIG
ncbi:uncharacterized protein LOC135835611 [Planococcus citri]|uniref:uncharacterized protein LOC135835611 n=1 Tax=Planococcus citri TaxID=170843 RepID=UPI0031F928BA